LSKVYLATEAGGIPFLPFITMPYEIWTDIAPLPQGQTVTVEDYALLIPISVLFLLVSLYHAEARIGVLYSHCFAQVWKTGVH
jgi:hypothetical protein